MKQVQTSARRLWRGILGSRKRIWYIAAGAAALAIGLGLTLLLSLQSFKPRIEAAASDAVGMEVRAKGRLGVSLFPGFNLSLNKVSVRNGNTEVIAAEKLLVRLELLPLLTRRETRVTRIELVKPGITIARYKNGDYSFEKPGKAAAGEPFLIKDIVISNGKLTYTEESSGVKVETDDFNAEILDLSYNGKGGAKPFNDLTFDGKAECKTLAINNFTFKALALNAAGRNGRLELNPIKLNIFGGTGKGSFRADFTGAATRYRAAAALNRFNLMDMFSAPGIKNTGSRMEGTVDFTADLAATGDSLTELKRSLSGGLSLNGENLMIYGLDIDALIPKLERSQNFNLIDLGAFLVAGPFGSAITKTYNLGSAYIESRGGKGVVRRFVSVWKVKGGVADAADVALATKKYRLAMKGGLDFNNGRFADVTIAVLTKRGCAAYSQKISGPFGKPSVGKTTILKSLTGPATNALETAWDLIWSCKVIYTGSVAQPGK